MLYAGKDSWRSHPVQESFTLTPTSVHHGQVFGMVHLVGNRACRVLSPCQPLGWEVSNRMRREQSRIHPSVSVGPSSPRPRVPSFWFMVPTFRFSISITHVCCLNFSCLTTFTGELSFHFLIQHTSWFIAHTTESFNWIYICLDSICQCGMNLHQVGSSFAEFIRNPHSKHSETGRLVSSWGERQPLWGMAAFFPMPI